MGLLSALLFLKAIRQSELSLTIPLLSLSPMFSSLFSFFFLNEKLLNIQYLGIFLIILGTLILYSKKLTLNEILQSFKIILTNNSAKLMVLVSIIWSLTPVLDKLCLKNSSINIHGVIQSSGMIILLIFLSKKKRRLRNCKYEKKLEINFAYSFNWNYCNYFTILCNTK